MSLQPEVNLDHVKEAGLDPGQVPGGRRSLIEWAKAMTKRDGDKVTRSGIMMTGSGVQPTVTWGIVAAQMGFQRASTISRQPAVNPEAGIAAMEWVLDLFDKSKVCTRDVTDRYKAFGTGQGSIFWTGPWTLNGYRRPEAPLPHLPVPEHRRQAGDLFRGWAAWSSTCRRTRAATRPRWQAVKWLSDNSFLWTTVGRGASPRKSILNTPDYKTAGAPVERARRLRRRHGLRDRGRDPGRRPAPTSPSTRAATSSPRRSRASGPARRSPRRRWHGSASNGRRASTPVEAARAAIRLGRRCRELGEAIEGGRHRRPAARRSGRPSIGPAIVFVAFFTMPFLLFNVMPILFGVYVSFTEWSIIGEPVLGRPRELPRGRWRRSLAGTGFRQRLPLRAASSSRASSSPASLLRPLRQPGLAALGPRPDAALHAQRRLGDRDRPGLGLAARHPVRPPQRLSGPCSASPDPLADQHALVAGRRLDRLGLVGSRPRLRAAARRAAGRAGGTLRGGRARWRRPPAPASGTSRCRICARRSAWS